MVELTYGGAWFKWSTLDRRDRVLAFISIGTSLLAAIPIGIAVSEWAFAAGFQLGSGGRELPPGHMPELTASSHYKWLILASVALAATSALTWWRFSTHQDEMFNRIQNYAIAQAGAWTFAAAFVWWTLSLGGWVGPLPLTLLIALGLTLLAGFWFHAVRRWA